MPGIDKPKPPRVTRRRAETRERLLGAAFEVFAAKGFGRARIEDICSAAGYTRGAFYSQFSSLEELFFVLYDRRATLIVSQVQDALATVVDPLDLAVFVEHLSATLLLDRDWLLVKTDFLTHAARRPAVASRLLAHRGQLRATIAARLGDSALALPPALGSAASAAWAVIAAYDGVTVQLLLDEDQAAAREWLARLISQLVTGPAGIAVPPTG